MDLLEFLRMQQEQGQGQTAPGSPATPPYVPQFQRIQPIKGGILGALSNLQTPPAAMARLPDQGDVLGGSPPVNKPGAIILKKEKEEEDSGGGGGLFGTLFSLGMKAFGL